MSIQQTSDFAENKPGGIWEESLMAADAIDYPNVCAPDYMPVEQLRELQLGRLQATVTLAWQQVELFRSRMEERGLRPQDIRSLDDIEKLPFAMKSDLRDTYPFGLFASPMKDIVRLHASSGTTGKPIVVSYTQQDVDMWTSVMVRCLAGSGLHRNDIVQIAFGYGLFTGGLGYHYGVEALGAAVIPASGGNAARQITLMKDIGVTAICCTPTYFLHLIDRAAEIGVDLKELPLRIGFFGAEPWTELMRERIEDCSNLEAFDLYGLSEIIGPGVGCECRQHDGLHIIEDHFYPEIIDPETGETLPDGVEGELVFTTLTKQAMPIIRYRTRDISTILPGQCACGRTMRRIRRIGHRSDDMLIVRGVNIFPSQIEAALLAVEGTLPHYRIILTREQGLDQMDVQVEVTPQMFNDKILALRALHERLQAALDHVLGIRVHVSLVEMRTLERSEGKAKRVIDRRTQ
jgi:phenylacetate-CoA ligase